MKFPAPFRSGLMPSILLIALMCHFLGLPLIHILLLKQSLDLTESFSSFTSPLLAVNHRYTLVVSHLSRSSVGSMAQVSNHAPSSFLLFCISLTLCPHLCGEKSHKHIAKAHFKLMTPNLKRRMENSHPSRKFHPSRALFHSFSSHSSAPLPHSYLTVRI